MNARKETMELQKPNPGTRALQDPYDNVKSNRAQAIN